uniref:Uncharacterized protein n=1 Tax=Kalanchoe fedtschenkoi TaxID=63787 RepID=A0A7N0TYH7_KALFE
MEDAARRRCLLLLHSLNHFSPSLPLPLFPCRSLDDRFDRQCRRIPAWCSRMSRITARRQSIVILKQTLFDLLTQLSLATVVQHIISEFLKNRPAQTSEFRPLNGFDLATNAELALKDAEKVINIKSNSVRAYILKSSALILLEKYEMARDAILSGLQVDPTSKSLQLSLQNLESVTASIIGKKREGSTERTDDFDCTLCLKLLYEPITTPCGHSFCRSCLFQSMDRSNKCPLCRTVLFIIPRTCAVSVTLNNIIQKTFPEEYAERKMEHDSLTNPGVNLIPLFVMDVVVPSQKLSLHIFEPRYRLMVRRVMEGNRRMGMVNIDVSTGSIADYACEVEITECEPLPDGRFYIEIESRRRFHILKSWDQDGYRVADVEWVEDIYPPEGTPERRELMEMTNNLAESARAWLNKQKVAARQDRRHLEYLLAIEATMPSAQDPERFSFWFASLAERSSSEKVDLLRSRDTRQRLELGLNFMRTRW